MGNLELMVLASGSGGNAAIVRNSITGGCILVDCGICKRDFFSRCGQLGVDASRIEAVFISHEHGDHTKGLGVVLRGLAREGVHPTLFTSIAVRDASKFIQEVCGFAHGRPAKTIHAADGDRFAVGGVESDALIDGLGTMERQTCVHKLALVAGTPNCNTNGEGGCEPSSPALAAFSSFKAGDALSVAGMQVHVFPTNHDCSESFGFRMECDGDAVGWMTDTGVVTPAAHEALSGVRILGIESNHDSEMLRTGPYPLSLKQRVGGDAGHLSNEQCTREVGRLLHSGLQHIVCLHISEKNNTYGIPKRSVEALLQAEQHSANVISALQHGAVFLP